METYIVKIVTHIGCKKRYCVVAPNSIKAIEEVLKSYKINGSTEPTGIPKKISVKSCEADKEESDGDF